MRTEPSSRTYRGHVLIPIIDESTEQPFGWEAYPNHPDWRHVTDGEPVVAAGTLTEVMAQVRNHIRFTRIFGEG